MSTATFRDPLLALSDAVAAFFEDQGVSASVALGWTARARNDNQGPGGANRVIFIPGEFDPNTGEPKALRAGVIDRYGPQNHVDNDPTLRAAAWWHLPVTCSVWAADPTRPDDERAQISCTTALLQWTMQALRNAVDPATGTELGGGNIEEFGQAFWTLPPVEGAFGRELTFVFVLLEPLFDVPTELAYPQPAVARQPAA